MEDVELRFELLKMSRDYLFQDWEQKVLVERATADFENRPLKRISPPTLFRITSTAEKMYDFVLSKNSERPVLSSEDGAEDSSDEEVEETEPEEDSE